MSTFDHDAASTFGHCVDCTLCCPRAGVAGLTTALLLAKESRYQITVAAKHMPGVILLLDGPYCGCLRKAPDVHVF